MIKFIASGISVVLVQCAKSVIMNRYPWSRAESDLTDGYSRHAYESSANASPSRSFENAISKAPTVNDSELRYSGMTPAPICFAMSSSSANEVSMSNG